MSKRINDNNENTMSGKIRKKSDKSTKNEIIDNEINNSQLDDNRNSGNVSSSKNDTKATINYQRKIDNVESLADNSLSPKEIISKDDDEEFKESPKRSSRRRTSSESDLESSDSERVVVTEDGKIPGDLFVYLDQKELKNRKVGYTRLLEAVALIKVISVPLSVGSERPYLNAEVPEWLLPSQDDDHDRILMKCEMHAYLRVIKTNKPSSYSFFLETLKNTDSNESINLLYMLSVFVITNNLNNDKFAEMIMGLDSLKSNQGEKPKRFESVERYLQEEEEGIMINGRVVKNTVPHETPLGSTVNDKGGRCSTGINEQVLYTDDSDQDDKCGEAVKIPNHSSFVDSDESDNSPGRRVNSSGIKLSRNNEFNSDDRDRNATDRHSIIRNEYNNKDTHSSNNVVQVVNTQDMSEYILNGRFSNASMRKLLDWLTTQVSFNQFPNLHYHFNPEARTFIGMELALRGLIPDEDVRNQTWLKTWSYSKLLSELEIIYMKDPENVLISKEVLLKTLIDEIHSRWYFDINKLDDIEVYFVKPFSDMYIESGDVTHIQMKAIMPHLLRCVRSSRGTASSFFATYLKEWSERENSLGLVTLMLTTKKYMLEIQKHKSALVSLGGHRSMLSNNKNAKEDYLSHSSKPNYDDGKHFSSSNSHAKGKKQTSSSRKEARSAPVILNTICKGCGSNRHTIDNCKMSFHPNYNRENVEWDKSSAYHTLVSRFPDDPNKHYLLKYVDVNGKQLNQSSELKHRKDRI